MRRHGRGCPRTPPDILDVMIEATHSIGRTAHGAFQKMSDGLLKHIVALQADGVEITFRFQHLVKLREGKGGIGPKEPHQVAPLVSGDDRGQNLLPAIGAVDIALAQRAALKIARLVEHKEGMMAFAPEVTVPGRAFLIAVGGVMPPVNPSTARPSTIWRMTGSRARRPASLTSGYLASRPKADCRRRPISV